MSTASSDRERIVKLEETLETHLEVCKETREDIRDIKRGQSTMEKHIERQTAAIENIRDTIKPLAETVSKVKEKQDSHDGSIRAIKWVLGLLGGGGLVALLKHLIPGG